MGIYVVLKEKTIIFIPRDQRAKHACQIHTTNDLCDQMNISKHFSLLENKRAEKR